MKPLADSVFDVLVREAGANESLREQFLHWFSEEGNEFRFQGSLGFGGKIWKFRGSWYISCYPEDETPERRITIVRTNWRLREIE